MGTFFGSPGGGKAYAKWSRSARPREKGLTGAALESAVMRIGQMFPDNVIRGIGA